MSEWDEIEWYKQLEEELQNVERARREIQERIKCMGFMVVLYPTIWGQRPTLN